jgi:hypothetical protein
MSTVTATVLIGSNHPNDNGVNPHLLLKLWGGTGRFGLPTRSPTLRLNDECSRRPRRTLWLTVRNL